MIPKAATVLSAETDVQGDLRAGEDLRIEGTVRGQVVSDHDVVVARDAVVEGGLQARSVLVEGYVGADVQAHERLTVAATGQVLGDVRAHELSLALGGRIRGRVETGASVPLARWSGPQRVGGRGSSSRVEPGWSPPAATPVSASTTPPAPAATPPAPAVTPPAPPSPTRAAPPYARQEVVESPAPAPARGEVVEVEPIPAAEPRS